MGTTLAMAVAGHMVRIKVAIKVDAVNMAAAATTVAGIKAIVAAGIIVISAAGDTEAEGKGKDNDGIN